MNVDTINDTEKSGRLRAERRSGNLRRPARLLVIAAVAAATLMALVAPAGADVTMEHTWYPYGTMTTWGGGGLTCDSGATQPGTRSLTIRYDGYVWKNSNGYYYAPVVAVDVWVRRDGGTWTYEDSTMPVQLQGPDVGNSRSTNLYYNTFSWKAAPTSSKSKWEVAFLVKYYWPGRTPLGQYNTQWDMQNSYTQQWLWWSSGRTSYCEA